MRRVATIVLVVSTCVALLASIVGVWANRTLLDSDRFSDSVERTLDEPVVVNALAARVARELDAVIVRSGLVGRLLPADIPARDDGLVGVLERPARAFLASERGQSFLVEAVRRTHAAAVRVLESQPPEPGVVIVEDGRVSLNLAPVVADVLRELQERGLLSPAITVPALDESASPTEQIANLSQALGVELGPGFGQLVVYERRAGSGTSIVANAQRGLELFHGALRITMLVTAGLVTATLLVARNRRRALVWLALGTTASGVLAHLGIERVTDAVPRTVSEPDARAAVGVVVEQVLGSLDRAVIVTATVAALTAGALVVGRLLLHRTPE